MSDEITEELESIDAIDCDHACLALLDYLEGIGATPAIAELVSCLMADSTLKQSYTLRESLRTFALLTLKELGDG